MRSYWYVNTHIPLTICDKYIKVSLNYSTVFFSDNNNSLSFFTRNAIKITIGQGVFNLFNVSPYRQGEYSKSKIQKIVIELYYRTARNLYVKKIVIKKLDKKNNNK